MQTLKDLLLIGAVVLSASACSRPPPTVEADPVETQAAAVTQGPAAQPSASTLPESGANALTRVDRRADVCMVNDQYMGKEQIAVAVGDKTYFGCCAMCKEKLEKNASARTGTDPVSGRPVDKALAVIGRDPTGKVYYFESDESFRRFRL